MTDHTDPLDGLEERLRANSKAFESILALTPAQEHFGTAILDGREPSEQWRAKKQSKAEKKAARRAKLDPANQKSVLDVMKERERKRKRELGIDDEATPDGQHTVDSGETAETITATSSNKRAKTTDDSTIVDAAAAREAIAEKRRQKREKKKEKNERMKSKLEAKKSRKLERQNDAGETGLDDDDHDDDDDKDLEIMDLAGMVDEDHDSEVEVDGEEEHADDASSTPASPEPDAATFDVSANHSTTSSTSSIVPPLLPEPSKAHSTQPGAKTKKSQTLTRPTLSLALPEPPTAAAIVRAAESSNGRTASPKPQLPKIDQAILQERLRIRIEELRAKRKADGTDGQPAQTRSELLEQRRKKAEQRKAHKKELRRQAKAEEARKQEERLRGSGSPLSGADIFSPRSESNNFSFSRLAFSDGTATDASLSKLVDAPKQKGPQDTKTALLAAENKQKRLAGLDEQKRADIGEKDIWLNASKRAHGERVRDDTSLLKKALKRKEKQKGKSEKEWQERGEAVIKGKEMKQKRREDNLAKRRDEKGGGGKKQTAKKGGKKKGRPGFEGRFKA